jgi:hypothetical protein
MENRSVVEKANSYRIESLRKGEMAPAGSMDSRKLLLNRLRASQYPLKRKTAEEKLYGLFRKEC